MIKIASLSVAGALLALGFSAAPAQALAGRTFVSGKGTDSGAYAFAGPCRSFAFALTQTAAGGEIDVLDPAGYGPVTINKSISIVSDGVGVAAIGGSGLASVLINAGANDSVHLRGLTINGLGARNGILFNSGKNLAIENCVVRNFAFTGINISPSTSSNFSVSNTIASNNSGNGILVLAGSVTGVLSKVTANNNFKGINAGSVLGAVLNVTIVDSEASNNVNVGVETSSGPRFTIHPAVMLRNVVASNNGTGFVAGTGGILRIAHSVVTGNGTGVNTSGGGTIQSYGDNDIDGNTNNNFGVLTPLAMH